MQAVSSRSGLVPGVAQVVTSAAAGAGAARLRPAVTPPARGQSTGCHSHLPLSADPKFGAGFYSGETPSDVCRGTVYIFAGVCFATGWAHEPSLDKPYATAATATAAATSRLAYIPPPPPEIPAPLRRHSARQHDRLLQRRGRSLVARLRCPRQCAGAGVGNAVHHRRLRHGRRRDLDGAAQGLRRPYQGGARPRAARSRAIRGSARERLDQVRSSHLKTSLAVRPCSTAATLAVHSSPPSSSLLPRLTQTRCFAALSVKCLVGV